MSLPLDKPLDASGRWVPSWLKWFSDADKLLTALKGSGTTAQRPTSFLYVGRPYFDTTLGKPIWYKSPDWVDATGTAA